MCVKQREATRSVWATVAYSNNKQRVNVTETKGEEDYKDQYFASYEDACLITMQERLVLMRFLDDQCGSNHGFKIKLTRNQLEGLIGRNVVRRVLGFAEFARLRHPNLAASSSSASQARIMLRRLAQEGACLKFHQDDISNVAVLQVNSSQ